MVCVYLCVCVCVCACHVRVRLLRNEEKVVHCPSLFGPAALLCFACLRFYLPPLPSLSPFACLSFGPQKTLLGAPLSLMPDLIGRKVKRFWAQSNNWYDAVITDHKASNGQYWCGCGRGIVCRLELERKEVTSRGGGREGGRLRDGTIDY
jgi:hypothetical protein